MYGVVTKGGSRVGVMKRVRRSFTVQDCPGARLGAAQPNECDDSLTTMNAIESMRDETQIDDDTQKLSELPIEILISNAISFNQYSVIQNLPVHIRRSSQPKNPKLAVKFAKHSCLDCRIIVVIKVTSLPRDTHETKVVMWVTDDCRLLLMEPIPRSSWYGRPLVQGRSHCGGTMTPRLLLHPSKLVHWDRAWANDLA